MAPLSTRGLVCALRCSHVGSRPIWRSAVVAPTFTHGSFQRLPLRDQRRTFFKWSSSDDDGKADKPQKTDGECPSAGSKQEEAEAETEKAAEAQTERVDAVVPVAPAGLRRDTAPPFEPCLMALPLLRRPLFPGQQHILQVTHKGVIQALSDASQGKTPMFVGAFLKKEEASMEDQDENSKTHSEDLSGTDPVTALYSLGTRARIVQTAPFIAPGGNKDGEPVEGLQMLLYGQDLINMDEVLDVGPPLQVRVSRVQQAEAPKDGAVADEIKAYINETMHTVRDIIKISPQFREHSSMINQGMLRLERDDPQAIAHFAAQLTTASGPELMEVLQAEQPGEKLRKVLALVKKEFELSQIQQKIATQIENNVSSHQREFMLREQLKMIKKELGEDKTDGSDSLLKKFQDRLVGKTVPLEAKEAIDSEMEKFSGLAKESQEYQITRNYLDWLTVLPWGAHSEDNLSLKKARAILDRDHYGLADVKERILEIIAVGNLRGTVQGKIICFVGPPGVGKTSIGKSIAAALGREFYRFSVGGLYDVAEIKGHRRTYVGAMPGKVVQCLKKTQSANPLVLIDEVDKIGRGHNGDPSSALLELLDPSQNGAFLDHYLDVPVDASKILFVCTANVTDTIPGPLLDRMEVIRLSGYDLQEKLKIAGDYLVPVAMRDCGLWPQLVPPEETKAPDATPTSLESKLDTLFEASEPAKFEDNKTTAASTAPTSSDKATDPESSSPASTASSAADGVGFDAAIESGALKALIRWYCREAGVRNLQKHIEKICRKLAMKVVENREEEESTSETAGEAGDDGSEVVAKAVDASEPKVADASDLVVTEDKLSDLVGKPPFTSDRLYEGTLPAGTVTGLAWTSMGGCVLYMEATALPRPEGKAVPPSLSVTGQLGSVMKESSQLALLLARRQLDLHGPTDRKAFFEENEIHLHCPEGAVPKDGPSAGITMVTALLSLGLNTPARSDLAMTGEVSLNGKVLAIGGLKEKIIAARRAGCKALIFPQANRRDFDELADYLKEGLEVHYATEYSDVFSVAFPDYCTPSTTTAS